MRDEAPGCGPCTVKRSGTGPGGRASFRNIRRVDIQLVSLCKLGHLIETGSRGYRRHRRGSDTESQQADAGRARQLPGSLQAVHVARTIGREALLDMLARRPAPAPAPMAAVAAVAAVTFRKSSHLYGSHACQKSSVAALRFWTSIVH